MARGNCTFRQRDVTALLKAARDAGYQRARLEVEAGKLVVVVGEPEGPAQEAGSDERESTGRNEWDEA
jgi:hypothetical protein